MLRKNNLVEVVRGFIQNDNGEILWEERARGQTGEGMLCLPGGTMRRDEKRKRALRREVREETGLAIDNLNRIFTDENLPIPDNRYFTHYYSIDHYRGKPEEGEDVARLFWLHPMERRRDISFAFGHDLAWDLYEKRREK